VEGVAGVASAVVDVEEAAVAAEEAVTK
jgi:hypothetical protein